MKGKIGFVLFVIGASGIAESSKVVEVLISIIMLAIAVILIFLEVETTDEKKISKNNNDNNDRCSRPYFLH